jgi:hypothetical protein
MVETYCVKERRKWRTNVMKRRTMTMIIATSDLLLAFWQTTIAVCLNPSMQVTWEFHRRW